MKIPQSLSDGVDYLKKQIDNLTEVIEEKDARISELERLVSTTETKLDALEQYSRRANLRFQGLKENQEGEDIETQIINIINNEMGLTPPLQTSEIVCCHRVVLVKFQCERRRDTILRQRGNLKKSDISNRIFVNEDLTATGALLAYRARQLRKKGKIADTWSVNGKIVIKDNLSKIVTVTTMSAINKFE